MLVGPDGTAVGSVSGGCVEGAVYEEAKDVVETGEPTLRALRRQRRRRLRRRPDLRRDPRRLRRVDLPGVVPRARGDRRVGRPRTSRSPSSPWSRAPTTGWAGGWCSGPTARRARSACSAWTTPSPPTPAGMLAAGRTGLLHVGHDGERRGDDLTLFVNSFAPPARMVVFGAIDFAAAVARVGAFLGYRVTVCDARPVFATPKRFPDADEVIVEWPHRYLQAEVDAGRIDERTVLCVLTHDPKFDVPLLEVALRHPGRLRRRDGLAAHPRGAAGPAAPRRGCPRRRSPGCPRRSGWTSAPGRRRRPRSRSPRRSSPGAGAAPGSGWPAPTARSTRPPTAEGRHGVRRPGCASSIAEKGYRFRYAAAAPDARSRACRTSPVAGAR